MAPLLAILSEKATGKKSELVESLKEEIGSFLYKNKIKFDFLKKKKEKTMKRKKKSLFQQKSNLSTSLNQKGRNYHHQL